MIPSLLQHDCYGFVLLHGKKPFEVGWQKKPYRYNDKKLLEHIGAGGNYGIMGGEGSLLILDFDDEDVMNQAVPLLPETFTVRTGTGKCHLYFTSDDCKSKKVVDENDEKHRTLIDFQGVGKQAVGAGSTYPDLTEEEKKKGKVKKFDKYAVMKDVPIAHIQRTELDKILEPIIAPYRRSNQNRHLQKDELISQIKQKIQIISLAESYGCKITGNKSLCLFHSENNASLTFYPDTNSFHCFGCNRSGDVFNFVMLAEMCDFPKAKNKLMEIAGIVKEKKSLDRLLPELKFQTGHLPFFQQLDDALQLYGKEYHSIKKGLWYLCTGLVLPHKQIEFYSIKTDTRVHILLAFPSGSGKRNIKHLLKTIAKLAGIKVEVPTSLHPEQLVGKVVEREEYKTNEETGKKKKIKVYLPNPGYFAADLLLIDEALDLVVSKDKQIVESRNYLCLATDPIGTNEISKKLVEHFEHEKLTYIPQCTVVLFFQPLPLPSQTVTSGFFRRFVLMGLNNRSPIKEVYTARLRKKEDLSSNAFLCYLLRVKENSPTKWSFDESCEKKLVECAGWLYSLGMRHSEKGADFCKIMSQTLLDWLVRFSCVLATAHGTSRVTTEHIELAFTDLTEFFLGSLDFVKALVQGVIDYGSKWGTSDSRTTEVLEWLKQNEAVNEKSRVSIKALQGKIVEIYSRDGVLYSDDSARHRYEKMKRDGFIEAKQVGSYSSAVWLKKVSQEDAEGGQGGGCQGTNGKNLYEEITSRYNGYIISLPPQLQEVKEEIIGEIAVIRLKDRYIFSCRGCGKSEEPGGMGCSFKIKDKPEWLCSNCLEQNKTMYRIVLESDEK